MRNVFFILIGFISLNIHSQTAEVRQTRTPHSPKYDGEYGIVMKDFYQYYIINDSTLLRTVKFHGDNEDFLDTLNLSDYNWWQRGMSCQDIKQNFGSQFFVYCAMDSMQASIPKAIIKKHTKKAFQNWFFLLSLSSIVLFWKKLFPAKA